VTDIPYNTLLVAKAEEQKKRIESVRQLSMIDVTVNT
jgi:hypothetical protein